MPDPKETPKRWSDNIAKRLFLSDALMAACDTGRFDEGVEMRNKVIAELAAVKRDADDYRRLLRSLTLEDPAIINRVTAGIINLRSEGASNA